MMDDNGITDEEIRIRHKRESWICLNKISLVYSGPGFVASFEGLHHHPKFKAKAGY
jgi:hypothetical protein